MTDERPLLFQPLRIRGIELPNRIAVSPMAQYSAQNGYPVSHHMVHYGKFAHGGAGLVFVEATGVMRTGRITNGCLGLWEDGQAKALRPIAEFLKNNGAVPAIQLGHGGRKASIQRPWHGNGPQTDEDAARGDETWQPIGPSAVALADGWVCPKEMDADDLETVKTAFADAARRALDAGFDIVEVHMAHGYLLHTFLSPLSNFRTDAYGGSLEGRMRFPVEVAAAVRAAVPDTTPVFVRISAVDGIEGGWEMEDSVALARQLKDVGVDVIDCSSAGNTPRGATNTNLKRAPGFQAPFAEQIRREVGMMTQAVGLIRDGALAEDLLQRGSADIIAVGRQFLVDPFWALHAAERFGLTGDYEAWPYQYAWWLEKWDKGLRSSGAKPWY